MKQQVRAARDQLIGSVLLGRYRVVRELAKGGMGVVYLARAEGAVGFVRPVVIKLLLPEHAQDERFVGMFVREAKILSQLRHPSLVDVIEFGEQDGAYVLVLEYVRGYHLGQWLRFLSMKKRSASADVLIQIAIDVLEALHHAHELSHPDGTSMQIVHRDVSPSNILLDEDGRARLLDFGVARMRGGSHDYKTQVHGFMGKMPYTAPEMFTSVEASCQSDLYAVAVVLHEALLGRNVFRAEQQAATLHKVMNHVPEPVEPLSPGVPQGLDAVIAKALKKAPGERYADAREFALALRRLQRDQESDIRLRLATVLKEDFGDEMAEKLSLESLAHRDEAWRRLSAVPARMPNRRSDRSDRSAAAASAEPRSAASKEALPAPAAIGATVASAPTTRPGSRHTPGYVPAPTLGEDTAPAPVELPASPPPKAQISAKAGRADPTVKHSVRNPRERAVTPAEPARVVTDVVAEPARPAAAPPAAASSSRGMWIALTVVGALALTAIALQLRPAAVETPPAPIRVVSLPNEPGIKPESKAPPPAAATPEPTPATPEPVEPTKRTKKRGPDAQSLTLVVRRQQPKLEACFAKHSTALEGQPTTQLEFDLEASGKLSRVSVNPKALAGTALGECLVTVARKMAFPTQPHAVSFAIPITARRAP